MVRPTTTKGVLFADAREWKMQGRGGSRPIKSSRAAETVSEDIAGSAGGTSAAPSEKPAWMNNLRVKGLAKKAQDAIAKEMGVLKKSGIFKPLKKAIKLTSPKKAAIKNARRCHVHQWDFVSGDFFEEDQVQNSRIRTEKNS